MKGLKRKAAVLTVAASLAVGSMTACGGAVPADDVVMKVNGEEVSLGVANFYARYQQAQMETSYGSMLGEDMWSQELSEGKTYEDSVKDSVIEDLQMMYLLKEHAKEYNVSLTDEETKKIEETAKAFEENNTQAGKESGFRSGYSYSGGIFGTSDYSSENVRCYHKRCGHKCHG